jgi:hypothetical protein
MKLLDFAKKEFELLNDTTEVGRSLQADVLELLDTFSKQGHSGYSAAVCKNIFNILADYKPLTPLTGKDEEWLLVKDGMYQNTRCFRVFKKDGKCFDSEGRIFRNKEGVFTNKDSAVEVTFPYMPRSDIVDVEAK